MMVVTDDVDEWWMVIFVLLGMCKYLHHDLCGGDIKVSHLSIVCYSDLKPQHHEIQMDILYILLSAHFLSCQQWELVNNQELLLFLFISFILWFRG